MRDMLGQSVLYPLFLTAAWNETEGTVSHIHSHPLLIHLVCLYVIAILSKVLSPLPCKTAFLLFWFSASLTLCWSQSVFPYWKSPQLQTTTTEDASGSFSIHFINEIGNICPITTSSFWEVSSYSFTALRNCLLFHYYCLHTYNISRCNVVSPLISACKRSKAHRTR